MTVLIHDTLPHSLLHAPLLLDCLDVSPVLLVVAKDSWFWCGAQIGV